ncbi:MAG: hypothetical protein MR799_04690 [Lachnospiraceae bacterium]|nr:hypothetical protein [Lachnospiraceae bacterium]
MKTKYLIRGIGIGIIYGVLMCMIGFYISGKKNPFASVAIATTEAVTEEVTEARTDEITEAPTTEEVTTEATTEEVTTEAPTTEEVTTEEATTEAPTTEEATTEEEKVKSITVSGGMGSETISSMLAEQGLVEDANSYNEWLISKGYDKKLRVGTFEIPAGSSKEEIAKILTTKPQ